MYFKSPFENKLEKVTCGFSRGAAIRNIMTPKHLFPKTWVFSFVRHVRAVGVFVGMLKENCKNHIYSCF